MNREHTKCSSHPERNSKMLKLNLLADWSPRNLEPASIKTVVLITAMAFAAAGIISLILMIIFNLLLSYPAG